MLWGLLLLAIGLGAFAAWRLHNEIRRNAELIEKLQSEPNDRGAAGKRLDEQKRQHKILRSEVEENRRRIAVFRDESNTRHEGQQRLNTDLRSGVQEAKDVSGRSLHNTRMLSGELIHGSSRFVNDDEQILLEEIAGQLGLDWVTERHLLYMRNAVPALEGRLRGRLAAPTAAMVLRSLVVMAAPDPTRVLEIGTLYGHSAAYLHEMVKTRNTGFHQTIIDPFFGYYGEDNPDLFTPIPVIEEVFHDNMRRVGATSEDVEVIVGLAEDGPIRDQLKSRTFEVLVIDGDHSFEGVKRDFENYGGHVVPGGFVIIDDYRGPSWPDVTRYVDDTVFTDDRFDVVSRELRTAVVRRRVS